MQRWARKPVPRRFHENREVVTLAQRMNGPTTGFDYKAMQDAMVARKLSFKDLARATQISEKLLRRIACGFTLPSQSRAAGIIAALKEEADG